MQGALTDVRPAAGGTRFKLHGHDINFGVDDCTPQFSVSGFREAAGLSHGLSRAVLVQSLWRSDPGFPTNLNDDARSSSSRLRNLQPAWDNSL
jgi:hypothetical protein